MSCVDYTPVSMSVALPVVEAQVNGVMAKLILDTGATAGVIVTPDFARRAEIAYEGNPLRPDTYGVGGAGAQVTAARVPKFRLGAITRSQLDGGVSTAIEAISARMGGGIDGVIGYGFFGRYRLVLDDANRTVCFKPSQRVRAGHAFDLAPRKPLIRLSATINGKQRMAALDTGASATVVAIGDVADRKNANSVEIQGAGGTEGVALVDNVTMIAGPFALKNARVVAASFFPALSNAAGARIDAIIGWDVLQGGVLTIDYPARRLSFEKVFSNPTPVLRR